jgi:hypothetical protein
MISHHSRVPPKPAKRPPNLRGQSQSSCSRAAATDCPSSPPLLDLTPWLPVHPCPIATRAACASGRIFGLPDVLGLDFPKLELQSHHEADSVEITSLFICFAASAASFEGVSPQAAAAHVRYSTPPSRYRGCCLRRGVSLSEVPELQSPNSSPSVRSSNSFLDQDLSLSGKRRPLSQSVARATQALR